MKGINDYYLNPEQMLGAFVGRAAHKQMEEEDNEHSEMFLSMPLNVPATWVLGLDADPAATIEFRLQGTCDMYDPEHRRITDYKWIGDWRKFDPQLKRGADRTAADDDHVLQVNLYRLLLEANGYPVKEAQIFYAAAYKDARRNVFDIELWDLEDTLQFATELAVPLVKYKMTGELPPPLDEEHPKYWLCSRCPVYEICQELALNTEREETK